MPTDNLPFDSLVFVGVSVLVLVLCEVGVLEAAPEDIEELVVEAAKL
jgi:hypothetical protein